MARNETSTVEAPPENGLTPAEKRHLGSLERKIDAGLQTFREVGLALLEIRDSRLYRAVAGTFEDYCRVKWQMDKVRAYQLIGAAQVTQVLGDPEGLVNEAQARELVTVMRDDPKAVKVIWDRVKETNEPVTAALVRRVRTEVLEPAGPPPPSLTETLVARINSVAVAYRRWDESKPNRRDRSIVSAALAKLEEATSG